MIKTPELKQNVKKIISALQQFNKPMISSDIAVATGIHTNSIGRYLKECDQLGFIRRYKTTVGTITYTFQELTPIGKDLEVEKFDIKELPIRPIVGVKREKKPISAKEITKQVVKEAQAEIEAEKEPYPTESYLQEYERLEGKLPEAERAHLIYDYYYLKFNKQPNILNRDLQTGRLTPNQEFDIMKALEANTLQEAITIMLKHKKSYLEKGLPKSDYFEKTQIYAEVKPPEKPTTRKEASELYQKEMEVIRETYGLGTKASLEAKEQAKEKFIETVKELREKPKVQIKRPARTSISIISEVLRALVKRSQKGLLPTEYARLRKVLSSQDKNWKWIYDNLKLFLDIALENDIIH